MNVKIVDVAARAQVSPSTVSRVLNHPDLVDEHTRNKVLKAIEELGYYPNAAAKNLRSQKTLTLGVIVQDIKVSYYAEIIKGVEDTAYANQYKVIICDVGNQLEKELSYLSLLMDRTVDGFIFATPNITNEQLAALSDKGYCIGIIGKVVPVSRLPCMFVDNYKLAVSVVQHLVEKGHRSIAFIGGTPGNEASNMRLEGFIAGLNQHQLPYRSELTGIGNFTEPGGYQAFCNILAHQIPFTAVFCANDEMALGVYAACKERNIAIPDQMAVVGVDNIKISQYISPSLSTVDQPAYMMGKQMAQNMIGLINDSLGAEERVTEFNSFLLIRESSNYSLQQV